MQSLQNLSQKERLELLRETALKQLKIILELDFPSKKLMLEDDQ